MPAAAQQAAAFTTELKGTPVKKWGYVLPAEKWEPVGATLTLGEAQFAARKQPKALTLELDTDCDGRPDETIKGSSGYAVLDRSQGAGGASAKYAVRFRVSSKKYQFASSSVLRGTLDSTKVTLIDQDNDGDFYEFGVDAMIVGKGKAASYLSKVVNLGGELYSLSFEGMTLTATPYEGEYGTLNLKKSFRSKGKLKAAVVADGAGNSYELSTASKGLRVPVGDYRIVGGLISKGAETARIVAGKMKPISVRAGDELTPTWGGPIVAEIDVTRAGPMLTIDPNRVGYYGRSGEEYTDFAPQGASPKFLIYDEEKGKLLATGRFKGC